MFKLATFLKVFGGDKPINYFGHEFKPVEYQIDLQEVFEHGEIAVLIGENETDRLIATAFLDKDCEEIYVELDMTSED